MGPSGALKHRVLSPFLKGTGATAGPCTCCCEQRHRRDNAAKLNPTQLTSVAGIASKSNSPNTTASSSSPHRGNLAPARCSCCCCCCCSCCSPVYIQLEAQRFPRCSKDGGGPTDTALARARDSSSCCRPKETVGRRAALQRMQRMKRAAKGLPINPSPTVSSSAAAQALHKGDTQMPNPSPGRGPKQCLSAAAAAAAAAAVSSAADAGDGAAAPAFPAAAGAAAVAAAAAAVGTRMLLRGWGQGSVGLRRRRQGPTSTRMPTCSKSKRPAETAGGTQRSTKPPVSPSVGPPRQLSLEGGPLRQQQQLGSGSSPPTKPRGFLPQNQGPPANLNASSTNFCRTQLSAVAAAALAPAAAVAPAAAREATVAAGVAAAAALAEAAAVVGAAVAATAAAQAQTRALL